MYMEAKLFGEAMRVANKHAPHLVYEINASISRGGATMNQSGDDIYRSAKMWED